MAPLVTRLGSKPVTLVGLVIFAAGLVWFSRMPADADFLADLLGPSLVVAVGLAATFVSLTVSAVDGIAESESGLASGLINTACRACCRRGGRRPPSGARRGEPSS
jgi:hypothetical protein